MKRFIDSILLMSGCILLTACNPSTEFATFDPANAKDLKDKDGKKSIISSATSGVSAEELAVVDVAYIVDNSNTVTIEQQNVTQVAQNLVSNLSGSSINIEIESSGTTTQAIQISDGNTDIISAETINEIEVLLTQLDNDGCFDSLTTPPSIISDPFVCPTEATAAKKVNVCHKTPNGRHDIQVSVNAVPAMSAHGDFIGTCALQDLVATCAGLGVNLATMECNLTPVEEEVVTPACADLSSAKKVNVCHQASGQRIDISVSVNAVLAHAAHGDFIGTCALQDLVTSCGATGVNLGTLTCN